jgi:hypothetical protein
MDLWMLFVTFIDTAGVGGVMVILVFSIALTIYYTLLRWILRGGEDRK